MLYLFIFHTGCWVSPWAPVAGHIGAARVKTHSWGQIIAGALILWTVFQYCLHQGLPCTNPLYTHKNNTGRNLSSLISAKKECKREPFGGFPVFQPTRRRWSEDVCSAWRTISHTTARPSITLWPTSWTAAVPEQCWSQNIVGPHSRRTTWTLSPLPLPNGLKRGAVWLLSAPTMRKAPECPQGNFLLQRPWLSSAYPVSPRYVVHVRDTFLGVTSLNATVNTGRKPGGGEGKLRFLPHARSQVESLVN